MMYDLKEHVIKFLQRGLRVDGRKPLEYRDISIETGITKNAEGSARVKIGETELIVGVKMEVGSPYPDTPAEGTIIVGAELLPLSSPEFEAGPPDIQAIELARVVDRGIRESRAVSFKKLCIEPGKKIWMCVIDVVTVNDAGNLFDAAALGAMAALKTARFPEYDGEKVNYKKLTDKGLPIEEEPISVTVLKIGEHFIVDPSTEEEKVYDARLTVAIMSNGDLCALQKGGDAAVTEEEISQMIGIAVDKSKELRKHLSAI
ncbi:exosome complex protein Rrp42 [Candidatus Woesearchaeota archaeon]|nr:exosome complex protein Rrp42 [Candidatus Woesearchaeota archaeon]